ncbi:MAG: hypothetical protein OEZ39_03580 [Gammaproteobacteria bacterium]|nr:hypothetical protein [Gammaproteobacteria bacterium]
MFRSSLRQIMSAISIQIITTIFMYLALLALIFNVLIQPDMQQPGIGLILFFVFFLLIVVGIMLIFPLIYIRKYQAHTLGETIKIRHIIQHSLPILRNFLLWTMGYIVIIYLVLLALLSKNTLMILLLFMPGLFALIAFSMSPFLLVLDSANLTVSLKGSLDMLKGNWLRTAIYLLLVYISLFVCYLLINQILVFFFQYILLVTPYADALLKVTNALLATALLPLFIALIYAYYIDLEKR